MQQRRPLWFLLDIYGWVVLGMSIVTAFLVNQWWVILLGIIGYLIALLVDLIGGRALGRTGAMRLARAEQENRELKAEQARLLGGIRERDEKLAGKQKQSEQETGTQENK
jgi:ABC-type multidrug transport system fused ATPase/permease subunit